MCVRESLWWVFISLFYAVKSAYEAIFFLLLLFHTRRVDRAWTTHIIELICKKKTHKISTKSKLSRIFIAPVAGIASHPSAPVTHLTSSILLLRSRRRVNQIKNNNTEKIGSAKISLTSACYCIFICLSKTLLLLLLFFFFFIRKSCCFAQQVITSHTTDTQRRNNRIWFLGVRLARGLVIFNEIIVWMFICMLLLQMKLASGQIACQFHCFKYMSIDIWLKTTDSNQLHGQSYIVDKIHSHTHTRSYKVSERERERDIEIGSHFSYQK